MSREQERYDRTAYSLLSGAGYTPDTLYGTARRPIPDRDIFYLDPDSSGVVWGFGKEVSGDLTVLDFRLGEMQLGMDITSKYSRMTWDAQIPYFLQPSLQPDTFVNQFKTTILHRMPNIAYAQTTNFNETSQKYQKASMIYMESGGEVIEYQLNKETHKERFSRDFMRPVGNIDSLRVLGVSNEEPHNAYELAISYGEGIDNMGVMSLEFPHFGDTTPLWNPAMLEWVLATHAYFPRDVKKETLASTFNAIIRAHMPVKTAK